jgi:hypothetical protein
VFAPDGEFSFDEKEIKVIENIANSGAHQEIGSLKLHKLLLL